MNETHFQLQMQLRRAGLSCYETQSHRGSICQPHKIFITVSSASIIASRLIARA